MHISCFNEHNHLKYNEIYNKQLDVNCDMIQCRECTGFAFIGEAIHFLLWDTTQWSFVSWNKGVLLGVASNCSLYTALLVM